MQDGETEISDETESLKGTEDETVRVTMEELKDEAEPLTPKEIRKERVFNPGKWIPVFLIVFVSLLLMLLLVFAWFRSIAVYVQNRKGEWYYLGRLWIAKKEDRYTVRVPETMFERCETTHFCFKPAWGLVQMQDEEEMYFYFPEKICMTHKICEKMELTLH